MRPKSSKAIDQICAAAKKAGKIPGIYCNDAERALAMAKRGFRFVTVGSDFGYLRDGIAAQLKALISARHRDAFSPSRIRASPQHLLHIRLDSAAFTSITR